MPENTTQPFAESDVLYHFEPTKEEKENFGYGQEEYAVIAHPRFAYVVNAYVRNGNLWERNDGFCSSIIRRLLLEQAALTAERDHYREVVVKRYPKAFPGEVVLEQGAKLREGE